MIISYTVLIGIELIMSLIIAFLLLIYLYPYNCQFLHILTNDEQLVFEYSYIYIYTELYNVSHHDIQNNNV